MSGGVESEGVLRVAKLLGARQTLRKPFGMDKLLSVVRYELAH
jgi:two-component system response regulator (stage 0 sporulation protein F)